VSFSFISRERGQHLAGSSTLVETIWHDVRYGMRVLSKNLGFTCVAVLTLAIGIGANTGVFSLAYQLLLRQLPVYHPEELVILRSPGLVHGSFHFDGDISSAFSYPMYRDLRNSAHSFSGLLARFPATFSIAGRGFSERMHGELVSGNYFEVLGIRPAVGRLFSMQDETTRGANPVAVLGYGYWLDRFGGRPDVINSQININGVSLTIVGVSPPGFHGVQNGLPSDIFIPLTMKPEMTPHWDGLDDHSEYWLALMARLKPGASLTQTQANLQTNYHSLLEVEIPVQKLSETERPQFLSRKLLLQPGGRGLLLVQDDAQDPLMLLIAMVGLILIITCTNLAGLLIAKGEVRRREIAVRLALGASRARVFRQLLTESLILAFAGGVAGIALAVLILHFLVSSIQQSVGVLDLKAQLDGHLLLYAIMISATTAFLFGLVPALKLIQIDPQLSLGNQMGNRSGGSLNIRLRKGLMIFQVAVTVILVAGAGLFTASLLNLQNANLGFRADHIYEFSIAPELNHYSAAQTIALADRLRTGIAHLPGVVSVSAEQLPLLSDARYMLRVSIPGYNPAPGENTLVEADWISPGYFSALGISLRAGRQFNEFDVANSPKVAVVNETFVRRFFPHSNPIGAYVGLGGQSTEADIQIVGIVENSKHDSVRDRISPFINLPYAQNANLGQMTFYVRTTQAPDSISSVVSKTIAEHAPDLPVYDKKALSMQVEESMIADKLLALLSLGLGCLAALIAALGLYGVMAYMIVRRTREIGVRIALGATRHGIAWLVFREVFFMAVAGFAIGLIAIFSSSRVLSSILFGVSSANPIVLGITAASVAILALLVGIFPAYRAAALSPTIALRHE
jgi:predicted permease